MLLTEFVELGAGVELFGARAPEEARSQSARESSFAF